MQREAEEQKTVEPGTVNAQPYGVASLSDPTLSPDPVASGHQAPTGSRCREGNLQPPDRFTMGRVEGSEA